MTRLLWTQRTDFGPGPRASAAAAFDSVRGRTVLFGGNPTGAAGSVLADTWEWDGSFWTHMQDIGPAGRSSAALVYDSARQVSILFGGVDTNSQPLGDTWQWDGANWTQLADTGPSPRFGHAMAFDSARNVTVLFGGATAETGAFSDTWEFDGTGWTQQEDTGPAARYLHAMAFDSTGNRSVIFGGKAGTGIAAAALGDTWAWDGNEWVQISEFGPSARFSSAMASGGGSNLILYGGFVLSGAVQPTFSDTWEFDGKLWTQRQDIGPGPLQQAAIAFDSARSRLVLFGGVNSSNVNSGATWESNIPAAADPPVPVAPPVAPAAVGVSSLQLGAAPQVDTALPLITTLTGPAPAGGVTVNYTGPMHTQKALPFTSVTIPAGATSDTSQVTFDEALQNTTVTVTAQVPGTPVVSIGVALTP